MKTLYLAGAALSGVLAIAPSQADQCAKVGDSIGAPGQAAGGVERLPRLRQACLGESDTSKNHPELVTDSKPQGTGVSRSPRSRTAKRVGVDIEAPAQ